MNKQITQFYSLTKSQQKAIDELRANGYAITIWAPQEIQGKLARDVERVMENASAEYIGVF